MTDESATGLSIRPVGDDQPVRYAAEELQRYLSRLGLRPDVQPTSTYDAALSDALWVGTADALPGVQLPDVDDPSLDDAIHVDVTDGQGLISGGNPRSVLLAAYRYLTELGFRWVRPGADGEITPPAANARPGVRVTETASYRHRGICIEGAVSYDNVAAMIDWIPKVGMNGYFIQFLTPMTFFERWSSHRRNPNLTPEPLSRADVDGYVRSLGVEIVKRGLLYHGVGHGWTCEPFGIDGLGWESTSADVPAETALYLAQVDGKRELWEGVALNSNLCYSNATARRIVIDGVVDYLRRTPTDIVHLWLADGRNNHCECDDCRSMRPSDYYVQLLNELDERLTTEGSNAKVVFLIYFDLLWPPQVHRLTNPDRFILMFAPITRTYSHPFASEGELPSLPPYERNRLDFPASIDANVAFLRGWQQIFHGDSFDFDYHFMWDHYFDPGYVTMARLLHADIRNLAELGLNGYVSCQTQRAFFPTGLGMTVMARTLWDATAEFDDIAGDYFPSAFGPDGEACLTYLAKLSELFCPPYLRGEQPQVDPDAAQRLTQIPNVIGEFEPTIDANVNLPGALGQSWRYLQQHARLCQLLAAALTARAAGDADAGRRAWESTVRYVQSIEESVQPALDVFLFIQTLQGKLFRDPAAAAVAVVSGSVPAGSAGETSVTRTSCAGGSDSAL